jgi:hydrogenase expression/formation protein HypD
MIKVPGSRGSLQDARARGADVRFVYSPLESLKIAQENPQKKIIFFAIGFETTTPMSAALLDAMLKQGIQNILFHINHVTIPEAMELLLCDEESKIDAFLGPSHVSVISGSKIYEPFISKYKTPVVVAGFEPVDIMRSISMLIKQFLEQRCELEVEYGRAVNAKGNAKAQALYEKYFEKAQSSLWRGVGEIKKSGLKLKSEYDAYNAELIYKEQLQKEKSRQNEEHKLCICGDILKGKSKPKECKIFGTLCTPSHPVGSCMVSSEGACAAYYKYGSLM